MSAVVVRKGSEGRLEGLGDKGARAYARFRKHVEGMAPGDTLHFEWREPRSLPHHRMFFAQLHALFDQQEAFDDADKLRAWLTVGAGYCDFVPGRDGAMVALPQSIAFHRLDETEFAELHARVNDFLWTEHARRYLWPSLTDEQTFGAIEALRNEFDRA